jgi:predicted secreted protein
MESSQNGGLVGAGGTHRWVFRGLVEGEARLTFRYYKVWEGEKSSIDERMYSIRIAKGGEISSAVLLVD